MALRTPALWMGNPAVQHPAQNDRLLLSSLLRTEVGATASNRPLAGSAGVLAGPDGTMGEVALLSNTQFTVNPARWYVNSSASALGGSYQVTNDALATLGITAQSATQFRRSLWGVWVIDSFVAGSGDDQPHWGLIDGTLAASAAAAVVPSAGSLPANFLALGEFLIPPTGQAVTYTPYDVRVGLRGGILPVTATDTRNGTRVGDYRDHPTYGAERWDGTRWSTATPLGQWSVDFANSSYTHSPGTGVAVIPQGTGSVTVPPGRQLEVEFSAAQLNVGASGWIAVQLVINGVVADGAFLADPSTTVTESLPLKLSGAYTNLGASASVIWSVQALVSAAGVASINAGAYGPVRVRHRLL